MLIRIINTNTIATTRGKPFLRTSARLYPTPWESLKMQNSDRCRSTEDPFPHTTSKSSHSCRTPAKPQALKSIDAVWMSNSMGVVTQKSSE